MRACAAIVALFFAGCFATALGADDVTIYRCTDASGRLTLRDTPCRKDQKQQTRTMVRPKDAPAVRAAPVPPPRVDIPQPSPRVVVVRTPRPLYECVPPDGPAYTSDSPEGHPRWVPLWTLGYPYSGVYSNGLTVTQVGAAPTRAPGGGRHRHPRPGGFGIGAYGGGTWIRDDCHALPQADVCARLVDRRDAIRTRFFNAMPSERDTLRVEERSINARLDSDCTSG
jgi:hypothetical protein